MREVHLEAAGNSWKVETRTRDGWRTTLLVPGREYVIALTNPRKLSRTEGRRCVLLDVVPPDDSHPVDRIAKIRYVDNNRVGRVELDELADVPADEPAG